MKLRFWSKITSKLRTVEFAMNLSVDAESTFNQVIKVVGKEGLGLVELVTQTYKHELGLKGVKAQEI